MSTNVNQLGLQLLPSNYVWLGNGTTVPAVGTVAPAVGIVLESSTTVSMTTNTRYLVVTASTVTFTLPTTSAAGDQISVSGSAAIGGNWKINQNAGQQIMAGQQYTTAGTGGSVASTLPGNSITLYCIVANTDWITFGGTQGTLTFV